MDIFEPLLKEDLIKFLRDRNALNYMETYNEIVLVLVNNYGITEISEEKLIMMRDNNLLNNVCEKKWIFMIPIRKTPSFN